MTDVTPFSLPPKLLEQVRDRLRLKHYSIRTETQYVHWIRRCILFHDNRHPVNMGSVEVGAFLTYLAVEGRVAASTQNQALSALLYLYREVLSIEPPWAVKKIFAGVWRAASLRPARIFVQRGV